MDPAVLLESQLPQPAAQLEGQLLVLDEALVGVAAQLVVRPLALDLLLDAIDDLLDLAVLDMGADQLAGADGLGVAEDSRSSPEDVVRGRDVLRGALDQLVLGREVPTGDGLSFDGSIAGSLHGEGRLLDHARVERAVLLRHLGWRQHELSSKSYRRGEKCKRTGKLLGLCRGFC